MKNVAVTGANGFIGRHVQHELAARGVRASALVRKGSQLDSDPISRPVLVDYSDRTSLCAAFEGMDAVVHLVGHSRHRGVREELYQRVNVEVSRQAIDAAAFMGVKRFVFLSSIQAIGTGGAALYTERTNPMPSDPYGRSKLDAEDIIRAVALSSGVDAVILRPPLVYGAGVKGNLMRLIAAVERGRPIPVARSHENARSLISARNLASAIAQVLAFKDPIDASYVISDATVSTTALVKMIADIAGRRPRFVRVPVATSRVLARIFLVDAQIDRLFKSFRIDPALFSAQFSWRPEQSLEEGLREAVHNQRKARAE